MCDCGVCVCVFVLCVYLCECVRACMGRWVGACISKNACVHELPVYLHAWVHVHYFNFVG